MSIHSRRRRCSTRALYGIPINHALPLDGCRFILSLRAVGEGHVSSLTFRSGTIAADGSVAVDPTARLATVPKIQSRIAKTNGEDIEVFFGFEEELSERVIFPITVAQSNGIEDARFVEFKDDARKTFYATYTAYSGRAIRSELLETKDFQSFRMTPLSGSAASNKGMALFPRKIDGRYAMIGRQDNENLYLIYSDDLYRWDGGQSSFGPSILGSSFRSAPVARRSSWTMVGCCLPMALVRSDNIRSAPSSWTRTIRQRFSHDPRTANPSRAYRARRLCAQRRLYLRRDAPRRSDRSAVCGL